MENASESPQLTNEDDGRPPQGQAGSILAPPGAASSFPDDIDISTISPEHKCEGADWFALFGHNMKRELDVKLVHTLTQEGCVCCVKFSADGKYLATAFNGTAQIYDVKTGVQTCVLAADGSECESGNHYIRSICFSPNGKYLATGAEDNRILVWDIAKKRVRYTFNEHQGVIYSLDFSFNGRFMVSGSADATARIWDMLDGTSKVLINNGSCVTSVAISPDARYIAAGSLNSVVWIWNMTSGALVERLRGHQDSVYSVAFTPDGKGLVSGSLDKTLKYWDVSGLTLDPPAIDPCSEGVEREEGSSNMRRKGVSFTGHKDYVFSIAVSHDGQWIVSGSKDRGVLFWEARNGVVQCMLRGHLNAVISVDLSPAGNYLATGSGDWKAMIWSYGNEHASWKYPPLLQTPKIKKSFKL